MSISGSSRHIFKAEQTCCCLSISKNNHQNKAGAGPAGPSTTFPRSPPPVHLNLQHVEVSENAHQLHGDCIVDPSGFREGPGEVEESGAQGRLQEDENGPEGTESRSGAHAQWRFGGGRGQQADALSGQLLHTEASRTHWWDSSRALGGQGYREGGLEEAAGAVLSCSTETREQNLAVRSSER